MRYPLANTVIIVLFLCALTLGTLILGDRSTPFSSRSISPTPTNAPLTLEQQVLKVPSKNSSQQERDAHVAAARKLAKKESGVTISNCQATPLVLEASLSKGFTVQNNDDQDHTLKFSQERVINVPAKKTITVQNMNELFIRGKGLYGYACDTTPRVGGFVSVVE